MIIEKDIKTDIKAKSKFKKGLTVGDVIELPIGAKFHNIYLSREAWPDTGKEVVKVSVYYSGDAGVTWVFGGGFGAMGGETPNHYKTGLPQNESSMRFPVPDINNPLRRLRVDIETDIDIDSKISCKSESKI